MTVILPNILILLATTLLLSSSIACFRSKDLFAKIQYIKIIGFFSLNLAVVAKLTTFFTNTIFIKSLAIIIINIFSATLLIKYITAAALARKLQPDCQKVNLVPSKKRPKKGEKEND